MPYFDDPAYGYNQPQYDGKAQLSGILGGMSQGGVLGGPQPSSFVPFGQPSPPRPGPLSSIGLALVAGLAGGRDMQSGLAEAGQNAQYVRAKMLDDARKQALNGWLKAGGPKDVQHPATQALFKAAPDLAEKYIGQQFTAPQPTDNLREYAIAKQQGFPGSFVDYKQQLSGRLPGSDMAAGLPQVGLADVGKPDEAAQAKYLAALPPDTAKLVKSIADYQMDISKVTSLRGGEREQIAKLVAGYDPTFDMTQYPTRAAMRKSVTSGTYSQAMNSANLLIQHAAALQKASDALDNGSLRPWNAVVNEGRYLTGDPATSNFETAKKAVAAEAAKVFKGTGASSEQEIKAWEENFSSASSPEQIKASIQTLVGDLLKSRLDTIRSQFESAMGKPANFTMLTPHSREILTGLGLDPAELDNPAGAGGAAPASGGQPAANGKGLPPGEYNWTPPQ